MDFLKGCSDVRLDNFTLLHSIIFFPNRRPSFFCTYILQYYSAQLKTEEVVLKYIFEIFYKYVYKQNLTCCKWCSTNIHSMNNPYLKKSMNHCLLNTIKSTASKLFFLKNFSARWDHSSTDFLHVTSPNNVRDIPTLILVRITHLHYIFIKEKLTA